VTNPVTGLPSGKNNNNQKISKLIFIPGNYSTNFCTLFAERNYWFTKKLGATLCGKINKY
jgi:hypothetical protein